jgi:hypothetical protein
MMILSQYHIFELDTINIFSAFGIRGLMVGYSTNSLIVQLAREESQKRKLLCHSAVLMHNFASHERFSEFAA